MGKNEGFVWDPIVNDPVRQEAADLRFAEENRLRAEREERLSQFHQNSAERKKVRLEIEACRYGAGAVIAGAVAYFAGTGGINWLAWILGIAAAGLAVIACFGFGRVHEMNKHY